MLMYSKFDEFKIRKLVTTAVYVHHEYKYSGFNDINIDSQFVIRQ